MRVLKFFRKLGRQMLEVFGMARKTPNFVLLQAPRQTNVEEPRCVFGTKQQHLLVKLEAPLLTGTEIRLVRRCLGEATAAPMAHLRSIVFGLGAQCSRQIRLGRWMRGKIQKLPLCVKDRKGACLVPLRSDLPVLTP